MSGTNRFVMKLDEIEIVTQPGLEEVEDTDSFVTYVEPGPEELKDLETKHNPS